MDELIAYPNKPERKSFVTPLHFETAGKETKRNPKGTKSRILLMTSHAGICHKTEWVSNFSSYNSEKVRDGSRENVNGINVKTARYT